MPKFYYFVLLFCLFFTWTLQVRKDSFAQSTTGIIVDGLINEQAWITDSNIATDFIMFEHNGRININKKTEVKVLYDNEVSTSRQCYTITSLTKFRKK
jgi:hypothetical protein